MLRCSVCSHDRRREVDKLLVQGAALRDIAAQFRPLTASALHRHTRHIVALATHHKILAAKTVREEVGLLIKHVHSLRLRAEGQRNLPLALKAVGVALNGLQLLARLSGELDDSTKVTVAVQNQQEIRGLPNAELESRLSNAITELAMSFIEQRFSLVLTAKDRETFSALYAQHATRDASQLAGEAQTPSDPSQRVQGILRQSHGAR